MFLPHIYWQLLCLQSITLIKYWYIMNFLNFPQPPFVLLLSLSLLFETKLSFLNCLKCQKHSCFMSLESPGLDCSSVRQCSFRPGCGAPICPPPDSLGLQQQGVIARLLETTAELRAL